MGVIASLRRAGALLARRVSMRSERAAAAVEYAIFVLLIAVVILLGVTALGNQTSSSMDCTSTAVADRGATQC